MLLNASGQRDDSKVYGSLVQLVLPAPLTGFFAAVVVGSILSTFNSVLNCRHPVFAWVQEKHSADATMEQVVQSACCSGLVAVFAAVGPAHFHGYRWNPGYFQKLNGVYFIPLLAVILVTLNRWVNKELPLLRFWLA